MPQPLVETLRTQLATTSAPLCVALSGGGDSSALLHALAQLPAARTQGLRALHVDHRLHPDSPRWAARCRLLCAQLQVPLTTQAVRVRTNGRGIEAAAREARYEAFAAALEAGEWLLTAHHRDDQAETVLLKLLRGAGPHGLAAMRAQRPLGAGTLWRPLLALPREVLRAHLHAAGLAAVDDPANADPALARSHLRHTVMPALARHWPQAPRVLARAAALQAEAADFLDQTVAAILPQLTGADHSLDAAGWAAQHAALRPLLLEHWLHQQRLPAPNTAQRRELERQLDEAGGDRLPVLHWPGCDVHVWRGRLHALVPHPPPPPAWERTWHGADMVLPPGCGVLQWCAHGDTDERPQPPALRVRLGERGVHLRPHGDAHTRALRILFQQAAVPPWWRRRCPLLYAEDGTLLAVADLWLTAAGHRLFGACGLHPRWQRTTVIDSRPSVR